jgi:hypothetical protein
MNSAITQMVHSIENGGVSPNPVRLVELIGNAGDSGIIPHEFGRI